MTIAVKPALVTFDVYMALLDIHGGLRRHVAEAFGLDDDAAGSFVSQWRAQQMLRAASSNSLARGHTSFRDCTRMALAYVCARHAIALDELQSDALTLAWDRLQPWPDADAALGAIRECGVEIAILSNGDQDMLEAVATQFKTPFDHVLSASSAGHYKPHPSVYALPETQLGLARRETLHVAGSANDVLGAVAYGLACIWSNRGGDVVLDTRFPASATVGSLGEAATLLQEVLKTAH